MRLSIRHTTRYRFDLPVVHALQRLRLVPKQTQGQEILDWSMEYENAREELQFEDQHHNTTTLVSVEQGTREVTITCRGQVDTHDHAGVIGNHAGHLPLWSFLTQSKLTRPGPGMRKFIGEMRKSGADRLEMLHELSRAILHQVEYTLGATHPGTSAEESFAARAGVCQDHAHIFIGSARAMDIPARYVSGYLMMNDRVEQDATHAWAEAYIEGLGWVGFDVSNGISPDTRYVRVATGRDYRDAAPVTGISFGNTTQVLEVDVAVEQQQVQQ